MAVYLNLLCVILLGLVAGLLMALWFQLRDWRQASRQAPLLAEQLAENLLAARKGLADLKAALTAAAPELNRLLTEGSKLRVELQYLLQRGDQMGQKLESGTAPAQARIPASTAAQVELVAGANGQAAMPTAAASDPLEELLAGLQSEDGEPLTKAPPKRKRAGVVTQAELDLQQSLQRKDAH